VEVWIKQLCERIAASKNERPSLVTERDFREYAQANAKIGRAITAPGVLQGMRLKRGSGG
jgi:hypothetical protein